MIIIDNKSEQILLKFPSNLTKSSKPILHLKNTETKKEYDIEFEDTSTSGLWYVGLFDCSNIPSGEYEYIIEENKGLLQICDKFNKKVYDKEITFKSYGD